MDNNESLQFILALRSGKTVKCPECKKGTLKCDSDPKISHFFYCTNCKNTINID